MKDKLIEIATKVNIPHSLLVDCLIDNLSEQQLFNVIQSIILETDWDLDKRVLKWLKDGI